MASGISQPVTMRCEYDKSKMIVIPTRLELRPGKKEKLIVFPMNESDDFVKWLVLQTDKVSKFVAVDHRGE